MSDDAFIATLRSELIDLSSRAATPSATVIVRRLRRRAALRTCAATAAALLALMLLARSNPTYSSPSPIAAIPGSLPAWRISMRYELQERTEIPIPVETSATSGELTAWFLRLRVDSSTHPLDSEGYL
jgi:hypothetical protein